MSGILLINADARNLGDLLMLHAAVENLSRLTRRRLVIPRGYASASLAALPLDQISIQNPFPWTGLCHRLQRRLSFRPMGFPLFLRVSPAREPAPSRRGPFLRARHALDLCGFALGDQWGAPGAALVLDQYQRLKRRGVSLIKLPASFGPFRDPEVADLSRRALGLCDLVCARDPESLDHLGRLGLPRPARLFPDYTASVPPTDPDQLPSRSPAPGSVLVIPNVKMADKSGFTAPSVSYEAYLRQVIRGLAAMPGISPAIVLHQTRDDPVFLERARLASDTGVPLFQSPDPRVVKRWISRSRLVITSRYHGAASALNQGVPCIGTSWSHKYHHLFADHGALPWLLSPDLPDPAAATMDLVRQALGRDPGEREIPDFPGLARATDEMWRLVLAAISPARSGQE